MKKQMKWLWLSVIGLVIMGSILAGQFFASNSGSSSINNTGEKDVSQNTDSTILPSSEKRKITPDPESADIDAVAYETISTNKSDTSVTTNVVADGTSEDVSRFALQYSAFVKEMNHGAKEVTINIYRSKHDHETKKLSWKFADNTLIEH
ncbi:hypothetical protein ACFVS2_22060 [Brevibacillus sp. NPDC058079]|uniref:hypothetical protein n=1 Tax=Brevibacillus sp. NPDC058079 TaxID=3346330 RepID=UPI0036EB3701